MALLSQIFLANNTQGHCKDFDSFRSIQVKPHKKIEKIDSGCDVQVRLLSFMTLPLADSSRFSTERTAWAEWSCILR